MDEKPAWQRVPTTPEEGLCQLERTSLADAKTTIELVIERYEKFHEAFIAFRHAIQWMYAGAKSAKKIPLPFDDACRDADCDPDIMREKMMATVPEALQRLAFNGAGFQCPFITGRVCGSNQKE